MDQIDFLALDQLIAVRDWKAAHVGALLQAFAKDGKPVIGMLAAMNIGGRAHPCLAVVGEHHHGELLESDALYAGALDLSTILEIGVSDPLRMPSEGDDAIGAVLEKTAGTPCRFLRAKMKSGMIVFVWLTPGDAGRPIIGHAEMATDIPLDILGKAAVRVRREFLRPPTA